MHERATMMYRAMRTGFRHVREGREALAHGRTDGRRHDDEQQTHVAHDRASHHTPAIVVTLNQWRHEHCHAVGPGDRYELVPPALYDDRDVETQDEGNGDEIAVLVAVKTDLLKVSGKASSSIINMYMYINMHNGTVHVYMRMQMKF